ncbi:Tad domain-containing protein [Evansella clarkii]|uniref:Tad domain-containing protein n=1 Tax=Evansella clarkii TaxID=79879 RepID=UPI000B441268|nr:Tad domain-containing protein [Evansella clarkii]
MEKLKNLLKNENGNVLVLVSLAFTGLIALTGLVIDGGQLYMTKSHLQKTANAAVLSGAQELTNTEAKVTSVVDEILTRHNETGAKERLDISMNHRVGIELKKPVPLFFSSIFGVESVDVRVTAGARLGAMGRGTGAAPLGIDESISLEYGKIYELKVDQSGIEAGTNFGILALAGTGARTYKDTLLNGYQQELKVGDIVETQTGNVAGPTREAVDVLVNTCSSPLARDCPRALLVVVYKPHKHEQNQLKQVEVRGFAYFYLTERMRHNDSTVKGMFIKRADSGFEDLIAADRGAYSIRLTE